MAMLNNQMVYMIYINDLQWWFEDDLGLSE